MTRARRVVWLTPDYHSNLAFAMAALRDAGLAPSLWTLNPGAPRGAPPVEHWTPPPDAGFMALGRALREADPALVVIRKTPPFSRQLYWAAVAQGRARIGYDQRPWLSPRGFRAALSGPLSGRPLRRLTPVRGVSGRPDPRATYLPFPVAADPALTAGRDHAPGGRVRVLCVGKLAERRKRQPMLLEALAALRERFDFAVTLVGSSSTAIGNPDPGQLEALRRAVAEGPLAGRLTLIEDAPFDAMPAIYAAHDLCVLPSVSEPLGTAPLEAMAHGCAALISDDAGSAGYVAEAAAAGARCGALFRADDPAALRAALAALLGDPEGLAAAGRAAAAWTRETYSPERFAEGFLRLMPSRG